jgi:hypothetical protein
MILTFIPARAGRLVVEVAGDMLVLNGEPFDLSPLGEGEELPGHATGSPWFQRSIAREGGVIRATLVCPFGDPPPDWRHDGPWTVRAEDGPVTLEPYEAAP